MKIENVMIIMSKDSIFDVSPDELVDIKNNVIISAEFGDAAREAVNREVKRVRGR